MTNTEIKTAKTMSVTTIVDLNGLLFVALVNKLSFRIDPKEREEHQGDYPDGGCTSLFTFAEIHESWKMLIMAMT